MLARVDAWHRAQQVRAYVKEVTLRYEQAHGPIEEGSDIHEWIGWATHHANRIDPMIDGPPSILDEKRKWESAYFPY